MASFLDLLSRFFAEEISERAGDDLLTACWYGKLTSSRSLGL